MRHAVPRDNPTWTCAEKGQDARSDPQAVTRPLHGRYTLTSPPALHLDVVDEREVEVRCGVRRVAADRLAVVALGLLVPVEMTWLARKEWVVPSPLRCNRRAARPIRSYSGGS